MAIPHKPIPSSFGLRNAEALLLPARNYNYFQHSAKFPFNPAAQQHSPVNAWWLAECALLAYEEAENIETAVMTALAPQNPMFQNFKGAHNGLDGFGIQNNHFGILCFRGTEFYHPAAILRDAAKIASAGKDVLQDSKLWTEKFAVGSPSVDAHVIRGFYEPLQEVWPELRAWIEALPPGRNLWLAGHSLGGAIAALIAYSLPQRVAGLYTFGSPCVGEQDFVDAFADRGLNERSFRYAHGNDAIAKGLEFPGSWFRHVGQLKYIDAEARKNIFESIWNKLVPRDLADHAPLYYALHCWNRIPEQGSVESSS